MIYAADIRLKLKPSMLRRVVLVLAALAIALAIFEVLAAFAYAHALQLAIGATAGGLLALLAWREPDAAVEISLLQNGACFLRDVNAQAHATDAAPPKLLSYQHYLGLYALQDSSGQHRLIWPDQISAHEARALRVWLAKFARSEPSDSSA
jgi:hypothetical protein